MNENNFEIKCGIVIAIFAAVMALSDMFAGKSISANTVVNLKSHTDRLTKKIDRYKKEKAEILKGSSQVGKDNWVQDVDGKYGEVIGAQEYEKKIEILGSAGDQFDLSNLFFQICLVMGAISLVLTKPKLREVFFYVMISLGLLGTGYSIMALNIAIKA